MKDPLRLAWFFFAVTIAFMVWLVLLSTSRILSTTEAIALQLFSVLASIGGSYIVGQKRRGIPSARSAFRRLMSLFRGLNSIRTEISKESDDASKIEVIGALVDTHLGTADDALADWEDIVPEDVRDIKKKLREPND